MKRFNAKYAPFWYHPDHLGSSSYITNLGGEINQHMEYLPFGELLVEEHLNSYNSPFKFNAKELDAETGNYYYGARYYDPKWSLWLSVDPLAEKYPDWSPYNYTLSNPVRLIDPDGRSPIDPVKAIRYVANKVVQFKTNTSGAQRNLKESINNRVEAKITGREKSNAQIATTGISVDAARDISTISQSVNIISNESGSIAKDITRDAANATENLGDGITLVGLSTAQPKIIATGQTISGIGTSVHIGVDIIEGNYDKAAERATVQSVAGRLAKMGKAGAETETGKIVIDGTVEGAKQIYDNFVSPRIFPETQPVIEPIPEQK